MDVGEKKAKREDGDGADRISNLPAGLKEEILGHLPIKDAMRTSVLSTIWEYTWTGMRELNLEQLGLESFEVFYGTINRIFMLHNGPIKYVRIVTPQMEDNTYADLSDWCYVLSTKELQQIDIHASGTTLRLPRSLFRCSDLKMLKLYLCELSPPPNFGGFKDLVYLGLRDCSVTKHELESLVSHCPLLDRLHLEYTGPTEEGDWKESLVITSSSLRTLYYDECWPSVIFKNVPNLTSMSLSIGNSDRVEVERLHGSWDSICSLPGLKELEFNTYFFGPVIGTFPRCLPTRFENLKTLTLGSVCACVEDDICFVLCLIRSSPGLQDLTLEFNKYKDLSLPEPEKSNEDALKLLEREASEKCKLSNLSIVSLLFGEWSRHEIMLVKVLLSRCPNIKSFRITPAANERNEDASREFEELPNKDKIVYLEPCCFVLGE